MFKLALIQMLVRGGAVDDNLSRAAERIAEAAAHDARVVLLPEVMDLGWTYPDARSMAGEIPCGAACAVLSRAAQNHGVWVCSGLTERDGECVYNAAVLIDPTGSVRLRHRKLNELDIAHASYDAGDRLGVCRTPLGTFGLMICADAFARGHVISRSLGYMGADVILSPCAWAMPADHDNEAEPYGQLWRDSYMPVARDFSMWIAGCSNVGRIVGGAWDGRNCIGCSMVIDAAGNEVIQGPYGADADTILYVDVTLTKRPARGTLWEQRF